MSFNFGAGKKPRVKEAFRFQLTLCFGYTTLFWLLMMLAPGVVAGIFTSDAALIEYTTWAMRIYMAGILAMGVQIACQQSFMALGQAKVSLLLACLRKIILLIPLIFILPCFTADKCLGVFFLAEPVIFWRRPQPSPSSPFDKILTRAPEGMIFTGNKNSPQTGLLALILGPMCEKNFMRYMNIQRGNFFAITTSHRNGLLQAWLSRSSSTSVINWRQDQQACCCKCREENA